MPKFYLMDEITNSFAYYDDIEGRYKFTKRDPEDATAFENFSQGCIAVLVAGRGVVVKGDEAKIIFNQGFVRV